MRQKLYVGNLPFNASEDDIRDLFQQFGEVVSVNLISDRETGRPRGFGFVEMQESDHAQQAIDRLNGQDFRGRTLTVNIAHERSDRGERRAGPRR